MNLRKIELKNILHPFQKTRAVMGCDPENELRMTRQDESKSFCYPLRPLHCINLLKIEITDVSLSRLGGRGLG